MLEVLWRHLASWIWRLGLRPEAAGSSAALPLLLLWLWQMCSGFGLATLLGEMGRGGGPPSLPGAVVLAGLLARRGWQRGGVVAGPDQWSSHCSLSCQIQVRGGKVRPLLTSSRGSRTP